MLQPYERLILEQHISSTMSNDAKMKLLNLSGTNFLFDVLLEGLIHASNCKPDEFDAGNIQEWRKAHDRDVKRGKRSIEEFMDIIKSCKITCPDLKLLGKTYCKKHKKSVYECYKTCEYAHTE